MADVIQTRQAKALERIADALEFIVSTHPEAKAALDAKAAADAAAAAEAAQAASDAEAKEAAQALADAQAAAADAEAKVAALQNKAATPPAETVNA